MADKRDVTMVASWDFSGPEGTPSGVGRGLVRTGQVFQTTRERSRILAASGKAVPLIPIPEPGRDIPERRQAEFPESFRYEDLTIADVMTKVDRGILTVQQALELERAQTNPRSTLIARLEKLMED